MAQGKFASIAGALMLGASAFATQVSAAEDTIGVTAAVNPQASGQAPAQQRRELRVGVNVVANERIVTTAEGQAQMLFRDESAFTIGPNSDVVLDEFVYDPDTQAGKIAFSATKGVFRLVGGKISKKTPVTLKTPTSTIGIRGGIALVSVQPNGSTRATFLFGDAMTVESGGVVKRVTRPGFSITAESPGSPPSNPKPVSSEDLDTALSALEGGLESEEQEEESGGETSQAANNTNEESDESGNEDEGGAEGGDAGEDGESGGEGGKTELAADDGGSDGGDESGGTEVAATGIPTDEAVASSDISSLGSDSDPEALAPETESTFEVALADTSATESTEEIADDANVTDSTQSSATDSIAVDPAPGTTTTDPAPVGLTLATAFSGRTKYSSNPALGSNDGAAATNLAFAGAAISNGTFDVAAGIGRFTINAEAGSFSATSTGDPFDTVTLSGTGNLRSDREFLTYRLTEVGGTDRVFAFAGAATSTFPSTGATFYRLSDDFIMGSIVPFIPAVSIGSAARGASGTNGAILWDDNQAASAQRPFGAVVMAKADSPQKTVVSIFVGEVQTVAGGKIIAGKMRGSARPATDGPVRVISGRFDTATDGNGTGFFGADSPDHFVLQATPGTTIQESLFGGTSNFNPNVVADAVTDTMGTRSSRTLYGFSAGYVSTESSGSETTELFVNANADPDDVVIRTSAETNKVQASFNITSAVQYVVGFGDLDVTAFGSGSNTSGNSVLLDDQHFAAADRASTSSSVIGNTVSADSLYMFTSSIGNSSTTGECVCQYLQWGHWGGQIDTSTTAERVHLAFWVAGPMSDYTTIVGVTGTATYTGHVAGTVSSAGAIYQASGGFSMMVDFSNPAASTVSIANFDGGSFSGTGLAISSAASGLATFANSTTLTGSGGQAGRTASVLGGFVAGGGDPAAEIGGQFTVTGTGYDAAGIVAGAKPASP